MSVSIPTVTIGLPVYNAEATVASAVHELLSQDFEDLELIISDNASTDGTYEICASLAATDRRIRLERQTRNIGANRNFDYVLTRARGEFFVWAAHDDRRDSSYVRRCIETLAARPEAVLAAPDVRLVHSERGVLGIHAYTKEIEQGDVVRRLRWILRAGGWFAIYGLIRRAALARTRSMQSLGRLPAPGLGPDYRVIELGLLGPFARIAEPLLEYKVRDPEAVSSLASRLDPAKPSRGTIFWWGAKDMWRMSGRHGFDLRSRLRLQAEYLASARSPGSLHTELMRYNRGFLQTARQNRRWVRVVDLLLERCMINGRFRAVDKPSGQ